MKTIFDKIRSVSAIKIIYGYIAGMLLLVPFLILFNSEKPMFIYMASFGVISVIRPTILFDVMSEKAKKLLEKQPDQKHLVNDYVNGSAQFSHKFIAVVGGLFLIVTCILKVVFNVTWL